MFFILVKSKFGWLDSGYGMEYLIFEEVCSIFSIYESFEDPVGVGKRCKLPRGLGCTG